MAANNLAKFADSLGNVVTFEGLIGSGKTLTAVALAYNQNKPVYSNTHLNFPCQFISNIKDIEKIKDSLILIDNSFAYFDSRLPHSGKIEQSFITSKNKIYLTVPRLDMLSKRVRNSIDTRCVTSYDSKRQIVSARFLSFSSAYRTKIDIYAPHFFHLYNTNEFSFPRELLPSEIWRKTIMTFIAELGETDSSMRKLFTDNLKKLSEENTGINYIQEAKEAGVSWIEE